MVDHLDEIDPEPVNPRCAAFLSGVLAGVLLCVVAVLGIDWLQGASAWGGKP